MRSVMLGQSGLKVSIGCLGTMRMGTATDEQTSFKLLDAYLEAGGNFLDSANVYAVWEENGQGGDSEELLAKWLRERKCRDKVIVSTKMGSRKQPSGRGLLPEQITEECDKSLQRLGIDCIDLYYAHFDDPETPQDVYLEAFNSLIDAGKVRVLGASNFRAYRLQAARDICEENGWPTFCCLQQRYSYLQPFLLTRFGVQLFAEQDVLDYCADQNVTLLAYSPLLAGAYARADRELPGAYAGPHNDARLSTLREMAGDMGITANQLVLAWMVNSDPLVIPIFSGSKLEQINENIAALDMELSAADMDVLDKAGSRLKKPS